MARHSLNQPQPMVRRRNDCLQKEESEEVVRDNHRVRVMGAVDGRYRLSCCQLILSGASRGRQDVCLRHDG